MNNLNQKKSDLPFIIIRLWPQHHKNETELSELLGALKRHRTACDEVWLCTEIGYPKLEDHRKSALQMAEAANKISELGIKTGFQIANTLGHGGLSLLQDDSGATWPMMIGHDGKEGTPCPCPRAPESLKYIYEMAKVYAAWKPSSVWIDDDLRMSRHGAVTYGCFCGLCIGEFSKEQNKKYDRVTLVEAMHQPKAGELRLAWTKFNAQSLAEIAGVVGKAVHEIAPQCRLGLQQIGHEPFLYSGPDWNPMLEQLAQTSGLPSGARLGHGFYNDQKPRQVIVKGNLIGRQVARLSSCVDQICAEIDNYTHNAFGKTAHGMAIESTLDLAMGCNSLSYAILCSSHEPMSWYETLLAKIAQWRPFWVEYEKLNQETKIGGIEMLLGMGQVARVLQPDEKPFAWTEINLADKTSDMQCLGLPLCMSNDNSTGTFLHADVVNGLSDQELQKIFKGGVLMDGLAAHRVQERGLGELLGAEVILVEPPIPFVERISNDPLNSIFGGKLWRGFVNASKVFLVKPHFNNAKILGYYEDRLEVQSGNATVLTENKIGGRIAIFGFYGWEDTPSGGKRNQILVAADWVSKNQLPVLIQSTAQVMVVPRVDTSGKLVSVFLLNASIEKTPPIELILRGLQTKKIRWVTPKGKSIEIPVVEKGAAKICLCPTMEAWSVAYVDAS